MDDARKAASGQPLPKAIGVYDRPKLRRSSRLLVIVGVVVVAIAFVLMILLR
jgi:hypothetical protein